MSRVFDVSVGFVVVNRDGNFLLLCKSVDGVWDFPKGHFNVGEVDEVLVALREFEEETNIGRGDLKIIDGFKNVHEYVSPSGVCRRIVLFLGFCDKSPVLSGEHSDFRWCSLSEAKSLMGFEEKKKVLDDAWSFLVDSLIF